MANTYSLKSASLAFLGISSLAIALPVLDTLGQGATFFVAHRAGSRDIFLFALLVYLVPTVLLVATTGVIQLISAFAANVSTCILLGLLAALWTMGSTSGFSSETALICAGVAGCLVGWGYFTYAGLRSFLQITGYVSPLVPIFFLGFTPTSQLLFHSSKLETYTPASVETPVVMLILDELSHAAITTLDGEIDVGRLPNFGRLARISTWYQNTTTVSTQTERAVPAILSGLRVDEDTQPIYSQFPQNLFSLLADSHDIKAIETATRLCPASVCDGGSAATRVQFAPLTMYRDAGIVWLHAIVPAGLAERYLPSIAHSWRRFGQQDDRRAATGESNWFYAMIADVTSDQQRKFKRFTANIRSARGPVLNYLHLPLPHIPWIYLPDGVVYNGLYAPGQSVRSYDWQDSQYLVDQGALRYALQLEYADRLLGEVLDALTESGRLDETLLIVVSDHGVAFAPGRHRRTPAVSTLADIARVPLFIKYPGQSSGTRDARKMESIDIFPTVADVLNLPLTGKIDGQSLLSNDWHQVDRRIHEAGDDITDFEAAMDLKAASQRLYRVIDSGNSALETMGLGAGKQYVGATAPAAKGMVNGLALHLDRPEWYSNVDLDSGFLPARLTGRLQGAPADTEILIALNGAIAGSGISYNDAGQVSIMLDSRRFRAGSNELLAYTIDGSEFSEILIKSSLKEWKLHQDHRGSIAVTDPSGATYAIDEELQGSASYSAPSASIISLGGWAYDGQRQQAPQVLLLIDGEEVLSSGFRMLANPIAASGAGIAENLEYWFSLEMDISQKKHSGSLSVLALFEDGRMLEIHPEK